MNNMKNSPPIPIWELLGTVIYNFCPVAVVSAYSDDMFKCIIWIKSK